MSHVVQGQQKVHADLLELYLRSRAKEADATEKEDWTKILHITIPKLKVCIALYDLPYHL